LVRLITNNDKTKLDEFYNEAYGKNHILHNSLHHDWQFKDNPYNNLKTKSIVVAENELKIVSHMGLIPTPIKIYDEIVIGVWHCSYFTLEEFRGIGLGTKMVQLSNSLFDCIGGLGNSDASNSIHVKNGGKDYGNINRFIKIFLKENLQKFITKKISNIPINFEIDKSLDFYEISKLDDSFEDFWNNVKTQFPITVNRTNKYLKWRYLDHPLINYKLMILVKNKKILGYAVLRFEDSNEDLKAGRIIDFISYKNFEKDLLQNIINHLKNKVDFVDFYCSGSFYRKTFESLGFFNNFENKFKIPTVFNPLNYERSSINLHFKYKNYPISNSKYYEYENLFFVKSDSDQDRAF